MKTSTRTGFSSCLIALLPLFAIEAVGSTDAGAGAPANLLRNPACEAVDSEGSPDGWQVSYSSGGRHVLSIDRDTKSEGGGSLYLGNPEGGAKHLRMIQPVSIQPRNRYRFTARARSVLGRATISLSAGDWITQPMPGTRGFAVPADGLWHDVTIIFEAGEATRVNVLAALFTPKREAADVWLDAASLVVDNPDYDQVIPVVSDAYETPHVDWARPHVAGRIATLFVLDARVARDGVEISQRMDLDASWFTPATDFKNAYDHDRLNGALDGLLAARAAGRPALVVLAGYCFTNLPPASQQRILGLVEGGAGLALFPSGQDDDEALRKLAPFEPVRGAQVFGSSDAPMLRQLAAGAYGDVQAGARGAGRILRVVYRPYDDADGWREWPRSVSSVYPLLPPRVYQHEEFHFWEYLYGDLARRLLDVAGVPATAALTAAEALPEAEGVRLRLTLAGAADVARPARCRIEWVGPEFQSLARRVVPFSLEPGDTRLDVAIEGPALTGQQAVHLWIETPDGRVLNWGAVVFSREGPRVTRLDVDRERYEPGETITGRIAVGGAIEGLRCVVELRDTFGRVTARQEQDAATEIAFALDTTNVLSRLARVTAELLDADGRPRHRAAVEAPIARDLDATDYNVGIWASYVDQTERRHWASDQLAQQRRLGVDFAILAHGYSDPYIHSYVRQNMAPVLDGLHRIFFKLTDYYRQLNLADPEQRRRIAADVAAKARRSYRWGGFDYSIGDECGYEEKTDAQTFRLFKERMQTRYRTIDALNAQWGTGYASWEDLRDFPRPGADYDPAVSVAPSLQHRLFMDDLFIDTIAENRRQLKALDPRNRFGLSGTRDPGHYSGFDWWKLMNNIDHLTFYDGIQREAIRSFRKPGDFITSFIGYDFYSLSERNARWFPWYELFSGMQGVAIYAASSADYHGFVNHDLTLPLKTRWLLEDLRELKGGVGKAILTATRERAPIAVLYSQKSLHASPDVYKDAIASFGEIVKDCGLQYDFLADEQLERGLLAERGYRALILPFCLALSDAEASRIDAFVRSGGTLLVVGAAGVYNEDGRVRESAALTDLIGVALDAADVRAALDGRERQPLIREDLRLTCIPAAHQARVFAGTATQAVYSNEVAALTRRSVGQGAAWWLNGRPAEYRQIVSSGVGGEIAERKSALETEAAAARRLLTDVLDTCRPAVEVRSADGSAKPCVEQVVYRNGPIAYLGLVERYFGGRYYRDLAREALRPEDYEPVRISLPQACHVYDMRTRRHLGRTDAIDTRMTSAVAHLYALLPYAVESVEVRAGSAVAGGALNVDVEVRAEAGQPVGDHVVRLEAFTPDGRLCEAYARNIVTRGGRAAAAIPLALNDPAGVWRIVVTEVASGLAGSSSANVAVGKQVGDSYQQEHGKTK